MAETETGQEKTEPATARRRQQARDDGQIPKSQELNTAVMLLTGVIAFYIFAGDFYGAIVDAITYYFARINEPIIKPEDVGSFSMEVGWRVINILAPFYILFFLVGVIVNLFQVGFVFVTKQLKPDLTKLNPITGLGKLFNMRSRVEFLKSIVKLIIILPLMIATVQAALPSMMGLMNTGLKDILIHIGYKALDVAIIALIFLIILAIIDYIYQRWQMEQDLKMTKDEVKQEQKDIQGDPQIRARIRSIQQDMARKRMMEEVPEAEVVVTNPTEYAIALKYDSEQFTAPQVVAKGRNVMAKKIKELAMAHDVPIVENRLLAQSLYKMVEVGDLIPPDMYQAVAEVLAYVYRLNNQYQEKAS